MSLRLQFILAGAGYLILLPASIWTLQQFELGAYGFLIAALPVLPIIWGAIITMRMIDGLDELQRRIEIQGLAFAATIVGLGTFAWGLLERAGLPQFDLVWVLPAIILLRYVGAAIARARYK